MLAEYAYYIFTLDAAEVLALHSDASRDNAQLWGIDKGYMYANTWPATVSLLNKAEEEEADVTEEYAIYQAEYDVQLQLFGDTVGAEIIAMGDVTELLSK